MSISESEGGYLLAPWLRNHVAKQFGREASILKEKRNAWAARKGNGNSAIQSLSQHDVPTGLVGAQPPAAF